jgi:ATP/maltotriose-dependent transcriptional regulator MalT
MHRHDRTCNWRHLDNAAPFARERLARMPTWCQPSRRARRATFSKDSPREELFRAVRAAHQGESVLAPSVATRRSASCARRPTEALSDRKLEVLALVTQGLTNRGAAVRL